LKTSSLGGRGTARRSSEKLRGPTVSTTFGNNGESHQEGLNRPSLKTVTSKREKSARHRVFGKRKMRNPWIAPGSSEEKHTKGNRCATLKRKGRMAAAKLSLISLTINGVSSWERTQADRMCEGGGVWGGDKTQGSEVVRSERKDHALGRS